MLVRQLNTTEHRTTYWTQRSDGSEKKKKRQDEEITTDGMFDKSMDFTCPTGEELIESLWKEESPQ